MVARRVLDQARVRELLPHGHPILLVDRVSLEAEGSAVGTKAVSATEPCYRHLPANAAPAQYAYPSSLLLESFGQTAAVLWLAHPRTARLDDRWLLMLVAIRDCRIEGCAYPGDVLRHVARIDHVKGLNVFVTGATFVGERRVAVVGSMLAVARPRATVLEGGP
jgi:3-hydroxyacyl-[acyl-carrier-protein] dehydratase